MVLRRKLINLIAAAATALPLLTLAVATPEAHAGIFISVGFAPPPLPVYAQPVCPNEGYLWTPGYWAYGDAGYYWVPGVWVEPPTVGFLWTPAYWGYAGGVYGFHAGYWGPHVGFYGGINYGFGYGGIGFGGGEWRGGRFAYNTAVTNVNVTNVHNVYVNKTVINNTVINNNHASFNGPGGIARQPTPDESRFQNERHIDATPQQQQHFQAAAQDRTQLAAVNHGRPATVAAPNVNAYHQVAQQHAQAQPISAADRATGKSYNPTAREANQDQRISNGLRSGQMTSAEAAKADRTQANINQQVHNDRTANGGALTNQAAAAGEPRTERRQPADLQRQP